MSVVGGVLGVVTKDSFLLRESYSDEREEEEDEAKVLVPLRRVSTNYLNIALTQTCKHPSSGETALTETRLVPHIYIFFEYEKRK